MRNDRRFPPSNCSIEREDILVHQAPEGLRACRSGHVIASAPAGEPFLLELERWIHTHDYRRPVWCLDAKGRVEPIHLFGSPRIK